MTTTLKPFGFGGLLDREFDGLISRLVDGGSATVKSVAMNVAETDDAFLVTVDAPGLTPDAFDVEFHEGILSVSGKRAEEAREEGVKWHRVERLSGSFRRSVRLGDDVDASAIEGDYADGVLTVKVPKAEAARPTRIAIR